MGGAEPRWSGATGLGPSLTTRAPPSTRILALLPDSVSTPFLFPPKSVSSEFMGVIPSFRRQLLTDTGLGCRDCDLRSALIGDASGELLQGAIGDCEDFGQLMREVGQAPH